MSTIKHDHTVVILEKTISIDVVNNTGVHPTGRADCCITVDRDETTRIVECILAECLRRCMAAGFIDIAQKVVVMNDLIHLAIQPLVGMVREVQEMDLNRLAGSSEMEGLISEDG